MSKLPSKVQLLATHMFEAVAAFAWGMVGLAFLLDPEKTALHSPLQREIGTFWPKVWACLYIVGGALIIIGLVTRRINVRALGLMLLGTGLLMQAIAAFVGPIEPRTFTYIVWSLACYLRVLLLWHVYHKGKVFLV